MTYTYILVSMASREKCHGACTVESARSRFGQRDRRRMETHDRPAPVLAGPDASASCVANSATSPTVRSRASFVSSKTTDLSIARCLPRFRPESSTA